METEIVEDSQVKTGQVILGRPSSYYPSVIDEFEEYFNRESGTEKITTNDRGHSQVLRIAADFPTLAGFASKIGVTRDTLYEWSTSRNKETGELKYPRFSYAYKRAKDHQERILVENALKGSYQGNFSIFTAKNVLGWRDEKHLSIDNQEVKRVIIVSADRSRIALQLAQAAIESDTDNHDE